MSVMQEFMSSACIEHLDFLDLSADVERTFRTFQEKDKGKHYRSLTEIPKLVKMEMEEAWSKTNVSVSSLFVLHWRKRTLRYHCTGLLSIPSLSTRIVPLRFQAGGRRRRPNLGLVCVFLCSLCYLYSLVKMDCGALFYFV